MKKRLFATMMFGAIAAALAWLYVNYRSCDKMPRRSSEPRPATFSLRDVSKILNSQDMQIYLSAVADINWAKLSERDSIYKPGGGKEWLQGKYTIVPSDSSGKYIIEFKGADGKPVSVRVLAEAPHQIEVTGDYVKNGDFLYEISYIHDPSGEYSKIGNTIRPAKSGCEELPQSINCPRACINLESDWFMCLMDWHDSIEEEYHVSCED